MSHSASINVYFHTFNVISVPEIIEMYITNGWNLNDFGHISLRPLGDKDDFDWIQLKMDPVNRLYEIIREKVKANEDPAIILMLNNTEVGAVTTFYSRAMRINFLLMINRKIHPELPDWTDMSWYLPHIIKPLLANGIVVSQLDSSDTS